MHPLLTFLADAVRYTEVFAHSAGPLQVMRLEDILRNVCTETLSPLQVETLTNIVEALADTGHPLPALDELAWERLMTRTLSQQLARVAAVLCDLIALREALNDGPIQYVSLQVGDRLLFDVIRSLTFNPSNGQPRHVLVGTLEWASDERIGPFRHLSLLTEIGITYQSKTPLPRLDLSVGSTSNKDGWQANRVDFPHHPALRSDLRLGRPERNPRGYIKTRSFKEQWNISNKVCELTASPNLKLELLRTQVQDERENSVLICERVTALDTY